MSSISSHSIFLTIYGQPRRDTLTVFPVYQPIGWNKTFVHSGIRKQNSLQVFLLLWAEYLFHKQKDWGLIPAPKKQEPCFKTGLQSYFLIQSDTGEDWGSGAGIRDHLSVMSKIHRAKTQFGMRNRTVSEAKEKRVSGDWDRRGHCSETIYTWCRKPKLIQFQPLQKEISMDPSVAKMMP